MELQLFSRHVVCSRYPFTAELSTKTVLLPISSSAIAAVAPPIFSLEPMEPYANKQWAFCIRFLGCPPRDWPGLNRGPYASVATITFY